MRTRVLLVGATGRTGNAVAHGLANHDHDVDLTACVAPSLASGNKPTRNVPIGVRVGGSIADIDPASYDVVVDLSQGAHAGANAALALATNRPLVIGSTGLPKELLPSLGQEFQAAGLGVLYCPNFSVGAVLMMQAATWIAERWPGVVEIVETHHDGKLDSPSGTAVRTAQLLAEAGAHSTTAASAADTEPARGLAVAGIRVHSLRLAGAVAHQDVRFGAPGEMLNIGHDAIDRTCYAVGVARAAEWVRSTTGLSIGLEHAL